MRRFQRATICLLFCCILVSDGFGADPIAERLLGLPWKGVLPYHTQLGQIVDARSRTGITEGHVKAIEAFSAEFGPQWYDLYVDYPLHASINRVYGTFLAEHLPFSAVMAGSGTSGEGILSLPLKAIDADGSVFILDVVMSRTSLGNWVLVAIGSIERKNPR
jgi:hypothetical protein